MRVPSPAARMMAKQLRPGEEAPREDAWELESVMGFSKDSMRRPCRLLAYAGAVPQLAPVRPLFGHGAGLRHAGGCLPAIPAAVLQILAAVGSISETVGSREQSRE